MKRLKNVEKHLLDNDLKRNLGLIKMVLVTMKTGTLLFPLSSGGLFVFLFLLR